MGGRLLGLRSLRFLDPDRWVIPGSAFLAKTHRDNCFQSQIGLSSVEVIALGVEFL